MPGVPYPPRVRSRQSPFLAALLALGWLLLGVAPAAAEITAAEIIYVNDDPPTSTNDGASWSTAYTSLQSGLSAAAAGDEIWVARGVYTPGVEITSAFVLTNGVKLYGGFAGLPGTEGDFTTRDWQTHVTVLSGDLAGDDQTDANGVITNTANLSGTNAYHVVVTSNVTQSAVLDGFTITGGNSPNPVQGSCLDSCGGGLFSNNGSPTLQNLVFSGNFGRFGGGLYTAFGRPLLINVLFRGNRANYGGGMHNLLGPPVLLNVRMQGNIANVGGGGLSSAYGNIMLINVEFSGNQAGNRGGGFLEEGGRAVLSNVTFGGNQASIGGGFYNDDSDLLVQNSIIWGNSAAISPSLYVTLTEITVRYSLVEGALPPGVTDGGNNLAVDPHFAEPPDAGDGDWSTPDDNNYGNLRLQLNSPAIDVGDNAADLNGKGLGGLGLIPLSDVPFDLDGGPRIVAVKAITPVVDLGPYEAGPAPPVFTSTPITTATEGSVYSYTVTAGDPNQPVGAVLTLTATTKPGWLTFVDQGNGAGLLSGIPADADAGPHAVTLQVQKGAGLTATQSFTITVADINNAPAFTSTPVLSATQDSPYSYTITTADLDLADSHTLSATLKPDWLALTDNGDGTGVLAGAPANADIGEHGVTLQVQDSQGLTATQSFTIVVANVNDAPLFTATPPLTAPVGSVYTYTVTTDDPDLGDTRTLTVTAKPAWLAFSAQINGGGLLTGTPSAAAAGQHTVVLQVKDAAGAEATQRFTLTVPTPTGAPIFTSTPPLTATVGVTYSYLATTDDPDFGDIRALSAITKPAWLSLSDQGNGRGLLSGAPAAADVGSHAVVLRVQDLAGLTGEQRFQVQVIASTGIISGSVFADRNGNGQQDTGEHGLPGVTVTLTDTQASLAGPALERETTTDAQGRYRFEDVPVGVYTLRFMPPPGYALPGAAGIQVTVQPGQTATVPSFGLIRAGDPGKLHLPLLP